MNEEDVQRINEFLEAWGKECQKFRAWESVQNAFAMAAYYGTTGLGFITIRQLYELRGELYET